MKALSRSLVFLVPALALAALAAPARADSGSYGYFRVVEGAVTLTPPGANGSNNDADAKPALRSSDVRRRNVVAEGVIFVRLEHAPDNLQIAGAGRSGRS